MTSDTTLLAKQINHGQSEIWLAVNDGPVTPVRMLATNEVLFIARKHSPTDVFKALYRDYHIRIGHVASLSTPSLPVIAAELQLRG